MNEKKPFETPSIQSYAHDELIVETAFTQQAPSLDLIEVEVDNPG